VQEDLVTLIESDDLEKNRQFVERLAARLEVETNLFKNIFFKEGSPNDGAEGAAVSASGAIGANSPGDAGLWSAGQQILRSQQSEFASTPKWTRKYAR